MNIEHLVAKSVQSYFYHFLPDIKGLSSHTILAYRDALKLFLSFASTRLKKPPDCLTLEDLSEGVVASFLDHVEKKRGNSPTTRNARLAAIRSFFGFVAQENPELLEHCRKIRAIPAKRTVHKTIGYMDGAELKALFDAVDLSSRSGLRDRALLLTLYNTGARVEEVVRLTIDDLKLEPPSQVKLLGKGRKQRACPLWPETKAALECYLKSGRSKSDDHCQLFLNANGKPITRFGVRHIIRTYAKKAATQCASLVGKSVGPHTFRHSTAMHLIQSGNDINMVRIWLGHANINTTHVYLDIDMEMKRRILKTTEPPVSPGAQRKPSQWQKPKILEWLDNLPKQIAMD